MVCCFPIHLWAIFIFLHEFPAYLMYLTALEIIGILAYILVFALLESLLATGTLVLMAFLLPRRWFLEHFVAYGLVFVVVTAIWLVPFHFWSYRQLAGSTDQTGSVPQNLSRILGFMLVWLATYVAVISAFYVKLRRSPGLEEKFIDLADRFTVPSTIFIVMDFISIGIILARNWLPILK